METNIILAGVGGQGILSIAVVLDRAALTKGWQFKQAEVHGMSQRGGAVQSHLRISDGPIRSELVPRGVASLILAVEPLEALRYVEYLAPGGAVVTGSEPFENIGDYPPLQQVLEAVARLPNHVLLPGERIAREAGNAKAQNMVLLGAASQHLGFTDAELEQAIAETFAAKGERVQKLNAAAYRAGKAAAAAYRACLSAGIDSRAALAVAGRLLHGELAPDAVVEWKRALDGGRRDAVVAALEASGTERMRGTADVPQALCALAPGAALQDVLFRRG